MLECKMSEFPAKGIKIDDPRFRSVIEAVNGSATTWTFDAVQVRKLADEAEARLVKLGIPKSRRPRSFACASSASPAQKSYTYKVIGSYLEMRRTTSGWRLTRFERWPLSPCIKGGLVLKLPQEEYDAVVERYMRENRTSVLDESSLEISQDDRIGLEWHRYPGVVENLPVPPPEGRVARMLGDGECA